MPNNNEDDKDLNSLKDVLSSLVASSKKIKMRQLLFEYRKLHGYIPLEHYGYQNVHKFILEQFNDCFVFGGPPCNPMITLKVPPRQHSMDSSKQPFVRNSERKNNGTSQNVPKNPKASYKTPRRPQQASNAPNTSRQNNASTSRENNSSTYRNNTNCTNTKQNLEIKERSTKRNNGAQVQSGLLETEPDWFDSDEDASYKELVKVGPDGKETCDPIEVKRALRKLSNAAKRSRWKEEEPLRDVRALVMRYPKGVWCSELKLLFKETYGRELYYDHFITVTRLVKRVPNVKVTYYRDRGDLLITDASRPIYYVPTDNVALFPLDCMQHREKIFPVRTAVELNVGDTLKVAVTEIYSPSIFWVRCIDDDTAFRKLMSEMRFYYLHEYEAYARRLQPGAVQEGYYCASRWLNEWRRSIIVKIMNHDTNGTLRVKVWHVDYGSLATCSARELWPLPREFSMLGAQAIRARLAGVRPAASKHTWPHDTTKNFVKVLDCCMSLSATVTAVDLSDISLELQLMHKVAGELVSVADELVRAGRADPRSEPAVEMKEYYLYPSFNVLEKGATLSFEEISEFLRDDINPYDLEEYRQYMPSRYNKPKCTDRRMLPPEPPYRRVAPPLMRVAPVVANIAPSEERRTADITLTFREVELYVDLSSRVPIAANHYMMAVLGQSLERIVAETGEEGSGVARV